MPKTYTLKNYYTRYLGEIRYNSKSTINHYLSALEVISKYLMQRGQIKTSIYEVTDLNNLQIIKESLYNDPMFVEKDERGHRMYSAALNNYFRFASGEEFSQICENVHIMDMPIPKPDKIEQIVQIPDRSSIIKNQVIMFSGYTCEINKSHKTFTSDSTKQPYMEGHHIIPISKQDKFLNSLDVYANIVSLCPVCHRLLHYGIHEEKTEFLEKIYHMRSDRLYNSGLKISKDDFMNISL